LDEFQRPGDIAFLNAVVSAVGRASQWQQAVAQADDSAVVSVCGSGCKNEHNYRINYNIL